MGNFKQWTTSDNTTFFPAGSVVKQLPPGYYDVCDTMHGICFGKKATKSESLIRFPDSETDLVIEEIGKFWELEDKFRENNLPYKRGIMLYGPPGSGKSCCIRLAIEDLTHKRNGIVIDFPRTQLFKEAYEIIRQIHPEMPIVVLMEDVDNILSHGESETLNLLDGIYDIDKVVFLATTNYPERLGSRIMNRPSRFDKKFLIGMPSAEAREMFIRSKLTEDDESTIKTWVEDTDGFSIAHIKELYVANRILGDVYDRALAVLRGMSSTEASSRFDDYKIAESWDKYGTGEVYKKYRDNCLVEGMTPHDIAQFIDD